MILPDDLPCALNVVQSGNPSGAPLVFLHALGADLSMWDDVLPHLPSSLHVIRVDLRGHGQSPCPDGPYPMGDLVRDVAHTLDGLKVRDCVLVGISIGGMIAQGLAAERLDLVRGLVLTNTAVKLGTPETWKARINALEAGGIDAALSEILQNSFARNTHKTHPETVHDTAQMLRHTPITGYLASMSAIAETDLYESTGRLRLPTLVTAAIDDRITPADLVRELSDLIPGSIFEIIRKAGHLAPIEQPETYANTLISFINGIDHG